MNNNNLSLVAVANWNDQAEQRKQIREVEYGDKQHRENVFRGRDVAAQNAWATAHPPALVKIWQEEAQTPLILPWARNGNLTALGKVLVALETAPVGNLGKQTILLAQRIDKALHTNERVAARAEMEAAKRRARELDGGK